MPSFEQIPDFAFRLMTWVMAVEDFVHPIIDQRVATFGLREGMTVVDYGCGPGRYTTRFARLVGGKGNVYAVDVHPRAIQMVKDKIEKQGLQNITPTLAQGYRTGLPDHSAEVVCAIDMFFGLAQPTTFLNEVRRILKADGFLIVDDGHQSRQETLRKINAAGSWRVAEETHDHLKCLPN